MSELAKKTTTGVVWKFLEQLAHRGVGILVTLVLARFLVPEDFGLVAMMAVFLALGQSLMDSGLKQALIRLRHASQNDYSTAFFANVALGLLSYLILYCAAPWIAQFYEEARLTDLIRVASLAVLIHSFQAVQVVRLSRSLDFKAQLKAGFPASLAGGAAAVILAYYGYGAWAIVSQMLLSSLLKTALLWHHLKWMPSRTFSWKAMSSMYGFGYKILLSDFIDIIFKNIYIVVIAKLFSVSVAGVYFFVDRIRTLVINQFVIAVQAVTYPALSGVQGDDALLKDGCRKVIAVTTYMVFPMAVFLAASAEPLFHWLFPEEWFLGASYLQIMCIASLLYPLHAVNLNVLKIKGRSDLYFSIEVVKKIVSGVVLFFSIEYGVHGILLGQLFSSVLGYFPNSYFTSRLIGYSYWEQATDVVPALVLSLLIGCAGYSMMDFFRYYDPLVLLVVFGGLMVILYISLAYILKLRAGSLVWNIFFDKIGAGAK